MNFSGDLILLTHMLMSGSWHIDRPGEPWQRRVDMRIVVKTTDIWAIGFNVPVAEFHSTDTLRHRAGYRSLGQDVLAEDFDAGKSVASLRARGELEVGAALLTQSILAGLGNVYKSEVCFACGGNPFRWVEQLSIEELACLVVTSRILVSAMPAHGEVDRVPIYSASRNARLTGEITPPVSPTLLKRPDLESIRKVTMLSESWFAASRNLPLGSMAKQRGLFPPLATVSTISRVPLVGLIRNIAIVSGPRLET
jgi:endonuclease-8